MKTQNMHNKKINQTASMVQALDNTGVRTFMYYPETKSIRVPEKTCEVYQCKPFYDHMPLGFAKDYVLEEDYPVFFELYDRIDRGEKTADATFHSKDLNYCNYVTLTTIGWSEDGKPEEVFGIIENKSEAYKNEQFIKKLEDRLSEYSSNEVLDEAMKTMATSIVGQYFAVYYIWLESHSYVCFQEKLEGILSVIGEKGQYEPAWEQYIENYIEEKYRDDVRKFVEISTIADRIGKRNSISIIYRRKEVGWTRGRFVAGKRDEAGKPLTIIYMVTDINEEMATRHKIEEAEQELLRDPLSKIWNRKAFEQFKEEEEYKNGSTALMLFDIDRFKDINDRFGHDIGDQVIAEIAQDMKGVLREKDLVFRMGGDEFAVLLYHCNQNIYQTICKKIEMLHSRIKTSLPEVNATISAGLCLNEDGYRDEMYKLADQALYNTKANGRGGLSLISLNGMIEKEWHDNSIFLRKGDILEKNSTMIWRADIPKRKDLPIKAYGDDLCMHFLGIQNKTSPEEVYRIWLSKVEPGYYEIIRESAAEAIRVGQAEVVYLWNHPEKGKVQLRCSTSFDSETDEYYSLIGYIHVTKDMHVFTIEDVHSKIKNALEEMFFCSFYISLEDYSFSVYKAQPYMMELLGKSKNALEAVELYIKYMIAEEDKESMKAFLDLTTINERMKKVNLLEAGYNDPNIGPARAKIVVVDRDANGKPGSIALVVETVE